MAGLCAGLSVGAAGGVWGAPATDALRASIGAPACFGSMAGHPLSKPVVGVAATPDGQGYWLAAADAGIFTFGDARYLGGGPFSEDGDPTITDFSSFAASTDGGGYLIADASGAFLLNFGDAPYYGLGYTPGNYSPVVGLTSPVVNSGYWEAKRDGSVYSLTPSAQTAC